MKSRFFRKSLKKFWAYLPGEQPDDAESWLKLNTNENPFPPPDVVLEAIKNAVDGKLRLYPSPTVARARKAVADWQQVDITNVFVGNGADEILELIFRAFVDPGTTVATLYPTYPLYRTLCTLHLGELTEHPYTQSWEIPDSFIEDLSEIKFVVNPNSPTGTYVPCLVIEEIARRAKGLVVVDEAYVDFAEGSCRSLLDRFDNIIIVRTFSKAFSLAGMRIGYALASPSIVEALDAVKDSYNVNRVAEAACIAAVKKIDLFRQRINVIVEERKRLENEIAKLGLQVLPSQANFLFVLTSSDNVARTIYQQLKQRRILIRYFGMDSLRSGFRVTVGLRDQNDSFLEALEAVLDNM